MSPKRGPHTQQVDGEKLLEFLIIQQYESTKYIQLFKKASIKKMCARKFHCLSDDDFKTVGLFICGGRGLKYKIK